MTDIILKKRDGAELTAGEIGFFIKGILNGEIPDYQATALLMAVFFRGMTEAEYIPLTDAMMHSGELIDLSSIEGAKVDKHSTGGVGDKTTMVLAPLVASAGVKVAKLSGRGIGHTGGTLDKLHAFEGLNLELSAQRFIDQVNSIGIAVSGQTADIVPADKLLYALRDVTATVQSVPLIASSIMSKKLACGSDAIVLDVKFGSGAFMHSMREAKALAKAMVNIGKGMGRKTIGVISNMNQPLGMAVGNMVEVREAIDTLSGGGPEDLRKLCLELGANMLLLSGRGVAKEEARKILEENLNNGSALAKFREFIVAQDGSPAYIDDPDSMPQARFKEEVLAQDTGYVHQADALSIGMASMHLGAGRKTKDSPINLKAGIILHKKIGDPVRKGEVLAQLFSDDQDMSDAIENLQAAFTIKRRKIRKPVLVRAIIQ